MNGVLADSKLIMLVVHMQCVETVHTLFSTPPILTCGVSESVFLVKTAKPLSILTVKRNTGGKNIVLWGSKGERGVGGTSAAVIWKEERLDE